MQGGCSYYLDAARHRFRAILAVSMRSRITVFSLHRAAVPVPPGSRLREDLVEHQDAGMFERPLNLPVEIGPPA
jgi:hypothetical protein